MRTLVVFCHPVPESFGRALMDRVCAGLAGAGRDYRVIDLYGEDFSPTLTTAERRSYNDPGHRPSPDVEPHVAALLWAEALVFVYPTWWYNLPAMLKGWLDRVLLPGVAFHMDQGAQGIRPGLSHIRRITVVTTCGASWWLSKLVGEPGRRTITRGLRSVCHPLCRTRYLALYRMDTVTEAARTAYLGRVERELARA
ncbi:NAD(P)H-dependent oxidoreductase [Methylobrevis albus]|uniref:NAD(P)H-dependent oxidoreductase n=1 Tax=Methylobrevis albus TaxID=2793297 RepID=A0A931I288_9HYPH|nr:NAD(P)H-dependent oxidoreductase [Methylobrevis albus]MBH0237950.1 NAD(P)H-dependent oxidoreductase [Methylobrevis albus]